MKFLGLIIVGFLVMSENFAQRQTINFNSNWQFVLNVDSAAVFNNQINNWRTLDLPHDWSIENNFTKDAPATNQGGALPGGVGWYKKTFALPQNAKNKIVEINFDGVYKNSEVWINGNYLGLRPNGYVNFKYDLTNYLNQYPQKNTIIVKVDNSLQPNSRWYSGSGIYRDVNLSIYEFVHFKKETLTVNTSTITANEASIAINVKASFNNYNIYKVKIAVFDPKGSKVFSSIENIFTDNNLVEKFISIKHPNLWSVQNPNLYILRLQILNKSGEEVDNISTTFGIRSFYFDKDSGFFLNNKPLKIQGVCMHHDLGILGAAFNKAAAARQLSILKNMGCNAIRFSHNPPASTMLDICDEMGFLVIDEAFDMWAKKKNKYDYAKDFKQWHKQDVEAMVLRDRNHPSVFMWSIGNEIREQFDSSAIETTKELVAIVKNLDNTRPVTSALTETTLAKNFIAQASALDVLGFNYKDYDYKKLPTEFPNQKFIALETASALATRGVYIPNGDTLNVWPPNFKVEKNFTNGNPDYTCSAYDNTFAYWGNTHERSWLAVKNNPHIAGAFVWSGFDYLGEPVPYPYPARSSYFGIVDLAGFPKDVYYMYQSEWTEKDVLHILPHWNWKQKDTVDVWVYYNNADEVELFVNKKSFGKKTKSDTSLHLSWRVTFTPGSLKAVAWRNKRIVETKEIKTTSKPYKIILNEEYLGVTTSTNEYKFITVTVVDKNGNIVPTANNEISFTIKGDAKIIGTENGYQADTTSLHNTQRKAFNGKLLVIVKTKQKKLNSTLTAKSSNLKMATIALKTY